MPAVVLPLELQVEFYRYFLFLSLISMASVGVESIANIRFPRRKGQGFRLYGYLSILLITSVLVLASYGLVLQFFYPNLLILIFCGIALNFKLLYISWLRVERPDKLVAFMIFDGLFVLFGSGFLFYVESADALLALILMTKLFVFVFFVGYDFSVPKEIWARFTKVKFIHLKYLFLVCAIFFISSLFIVHQATILRILSLQMLDDREFVALSIALSIGANIQKLILSYYWVIQKNIFSSSISRVFMLRQLRMLPALIVVGVSVLWAALELLNRFNLEASFSIQIILCGSFLMIHRLASASVRGMTLSMYGVKAQFYRQLGSLLIILPSVGLLFSLDIANFILVLGVALSSEFLIVYAVPMLRGWRKLDETREY